MIFDKCDQNKWQNSIVSFAEIYIYIYYILKSNRSSDQQWPEAVLIVLKFYFSAKNYGGCQKEMLEIHNVFLLQSYDTEQENFSFQGLLQEHGLYPTAIKM